MILQGNEDLRVVKTIEGIKAAFEALIVEKSYEEISVRELCEKARINKKTFYHYYETLDVLLKERQTELSMAFSRRISAFRLPEDLDKVIRAFYYYSEEQGPAYEQILYSGSVRAARDEVLGNIRGNLWNSYEHFRCLPEYDRRLLLGFVNGAVLNTYLYWLRSGKTVPIDDMIGMTNRIVVNGVKGFLEQ